MPRDLRFRNLERYKTGASSDNMTLSIPRPQSSTGKHSYHCPNEKCQPAIFQIGRAQETHTISEEHANIVRREPHTQGITCPYCGQDGEDNEFTSKEDIDYATALVKHNALKDVSAMLGGITSDFNRSQRKGGMISISMDHKPPFNPAPRAYREDLLRSISCHVCSREYGVYALALFCPDCGVPNVSTHFKREVEIIDRQVQLSRDTSEQGDKELAYRLLANAHEDVVTALETTLKTMFCYLAKKRKPEEAENLCDIQKIGAAFQNLEKAEKQFKKLDIELLAGIEQDMLTELTRCIQKRHIIGHNLALADEKYLTVDDSASVGQNVPLLATEIEKFAYNCGYLIQRLEKEMPDAA
jgi:hypothetical protein